MEVILKQDMQPLGFKDDIVNVKPGYGRNYLIPQGVAELATVSARKMHAETLKQRAKKQEKMKAEAAEVAQKIAGLTLVIKAKAGENGKIFGSVNNIQLADVIKTEGIEVDRKAIKILGGNPSSLGKFEAEIKLFRDVDIKISFEVVEA